MADCPGSAQSFHFMVNETLLDAVGEIAGCVEASARSASPHSFDLEHRALASDDADALAGWQVGA